MTCIVVNSVWRWQWVTTAVCTCYCIGQLGPQLSWDLAVLGLLDQHPFGVDILQLQIFRIITLGFVLREAQLVRAVVGDVAVQTSDDTRVELIRSSIDLREDHELGWTILQH